MTYPIFKIQSALNSPFQNLYFNISEFGIDLTIEVDVLIPPPHLQSPSSPQLWVWEAIKLILCLKIAHISGLK